jgi:ribosomal protein L11 methyltransferase
MSWNQLTFDVPDELTDAVVGELSDDGVAGVWESGAPAPGVTQIVVYFGVGANIEAIESRIRSVFDRSQLAAPVMSRRSVEDMDWTEEWKKSYTSFAIGNDFFVVPSWEDSICPADRIPIRIDPGQAFGTGTHETTQLTIEALERWVEPDCCVLDLGTGSGILAIASRLLAARCVFACDIDEVAVQVARANIERNAEDNVWTFCGSVDSVETGSIKLALCNLTADVIIALFPEIDRVLAVRGVAVFSGILQEQHEQVREVIERFGFTIHEEMLRGEWLALVAEKHGG